MDEFSVSLAGLKLKSPVGNAAGTCKYMEGPEGLAELLRTGIGMATVGSYTVDERPGNSGDVYEHNDVCSLNSMGLPGPGIKRQREMLPAMVALAKEKGVPIVYSAAGFTPEQYAELAALAVELGFDAIEYNLGCPNVWGASGKQKGIASYDATATHEILTAVEARIGHIIPGFAKISPVDPATLEAIAPVLDESAIVQVVTATNAGPNGSMLHNDGSLWIDAKTDQGGRVKLGGVAGPALKPWAMGVVQQLHYMKLDSLQFIGVGGVDSGQDIRDYMLTGASFVEAATILFNEGYKVVTRLLSEYAELSVTV